MVRLCEKGVLKFDWEVGHAIDHGADDGTAACFVDAEDDGGAAV